MRTFVAVAFLVMQCAQTLATAQEHVPNPAAKAAFEKARAAQDRAFEGDIDKPESRRAFAKARDLYRKAISLDPDYYQAHEGYTQCYPLAASVVAGTDDAKKTAAERIWKELETQYKEWTKEHPDKAVYPYILGTLNEEENPELAVQYYQQAVKIDPKYAPAYAMLSVNAEEHGDLGLKREYARKAFESWPNDVTSWHGMVEAWDDFEDEKKFLLQMTEKFPDEGLNWLSYVARRSYDEKQRLEIYELIRQKYPKQGSSELTELFSIYLQSDPAKARDLAKEMRGLTPEDKTWPLLLNYAQTVIDAEAFIAEGKAERAVAALDKVKLPPYVSDPRVLQLTHAKAVDASGNTKKAYDDLIAIVATTPSGAIDKALLAYGAKLGGDERQVEADVWAKRSADAKPQRPFSLVSFTSGKNVSTDEYAGKVYLVNFWYPKCGPCRGEFPFLKAVLDRYKNRGFEILAINGVPAQDGLVMATINGLKLGFIPLKSTEEVLKEFNIRGRFPTNFLIGSDGRTYYQPGPVSTPDAQRELELQIEGLLAHAKPTTRLP